MSRKQKFIEVIHRDPEVKLKKVLRSGKKSKSYSGIKSRFAGINFWFWFVILIFGIWIFNLPCYAKDISFEASVERKQISFGQSVQLNLAFLGTQNMPAPELPEISGFQSQYLGPSTMMSIVNGQVSASITHIYTLLPLKTGSFKIGPFKFEYKGDTYTSNAVNLEVFQAASQPQGNTPTVQEQEGVSSEEISDRVFLVMQAKKSKAYLNEIVPLSIKLYVNRLGVRDIQFPEFSHEGFSVGEFSQPKQYREELGGVVYDVIEFGTTVFGLRAGEFRLGAAGLKCNLIVRKENRRRPSHFDDFSGADVFDDFFGRYETYPLNLKSADIPLTVLTLGENKPQGFDGAVGDFDFEARVSPPEVKVGDPVTLKAVVKGEGNFNTVNLPRIKKDGFKIYDPQIKQEEGQKAFEQILMPQSADITEVPALVFSFFNPKAEKYQTITKGPFAIKVIKPEKEEALKIVEPGQNAPIKKEETLGRDIIYIKDSPGDLKRKGGYLYKNKIFFALQLIPLLSFIFIFFLERRRQRLVSDIRYARKLRAPAKAKSGIARAKDYLDKGSAGEFYDAVFATLQEYLGDKFHLSSHGITVSIIDEALKDKDISAEVLVKLHAIFSACDMARFAASAVSREDMARALKNLEETIDYFQRSKL